MTVQRALREALAQRIKCDPASHELDRYDPLAEALESQVTGEAEYAGDDLKLLGEVILDASTRLRSGAAEAALA